MLFDPHLGWDTCGGYPRGHLSFVCIFVFIEKFTSDQLITWSISRGRGALENKLFDPHSGWDTGGGYPRGHLSFVRIFVFIEKLTSDQLITWSISRGRGAVENMLFDPHSGWDTGGGYPRGHLSFVRIFVSIEKLTSGQLITWSISRGRGAVENMLFDPHLGWDTGGGYPRGHLSFVRIFRKKFGICTQCC